LYDAVRETFPKKKDWIGGCYALCLLANENTDKAIDTFSKGHTKSRAMEILSFWENDPIFKENEIFGTLKETIRTLKSYKKMKKRQQKMQN